MRHPYLERGKLRSIAKNRSGVEVNQQQGKDHRRRSSKAQLTFRGQSLSHFRLLAWRRAVFPRGVLLAPHADFTR